MTVPLEHNAHRRVLRRKELRIGFEPKGVTMSTSPNRVPASEFPVWTPTPGSRDVELGRLPVTSGRLAIRDVYDRERPQVVLAVRAGDHRVWATECYVRPAGTADKPVLRPAYLSVQLSDVAPAYVGTPEALYPSDIPPYGASVYTDLGIVLVHDGDAITEADMEALDQDWERAWESPSNFSEVRSGSGATVITCKTLVDNTSIPILASFDAEDRPVAIHIDLALIDIAGTDRPVAAPSPDSSVKSPVKDKRTLAELFWRRRWRI